MIRCRLPRVRRATGEVVRGACSYVLLSSAWGAARRRRGLVLALLNKTSEVFLFGWEVDFDGQDFLG